MPLRRSYHLGILVSHPIQYYAAWFRHLARFHDIEVLYMHQQDANGQATAGFGVPFQWDLPLLEGYPHRWLTNVARHPSVRTFRGCDTPEIDALLVQKRYDALLVVGWNRKSAWQAIRACWQGNIPVLMRGDSQLLTTRPWPFAAAKYVPYRWGLPRLEGHLYVGQRNKAYLQHYGVPETRLFFVPHCVDNAFFAAKAEAAEHTGAARSLRAQLGIPQEAFVFLFVGKLIPKKRPGDVLQACCRVFARPYDRTVHAVLVGDGPLRASLECLARPHTERIHFVGFRNQTELPAFYKAANALILPSDARETWGLVVNEAAACGIPAIVSSAAGCAPDLIQAGYTGYTYPVGDIEALARCMRILQERCQHAPTTLRRALAQKVRDYSIENATAGLSSAVETILATPHNGSLT
jgi:glycosyltransferase involved in cell wall biosynthesis